MVDLKDYKKVRVYPSEIISASDKGSFYLARITQIVEDIARLKLGFDPVLKTSCYSSVVDFIFSHYQSLHKEKVCILTSSSQIAFHCFVADKDWRKIIFDPFSQRWPDQYLDKNKFTIYWVSMSDLKSVVREKMKEKSLSKAIFSSIIVSSVKKPKGIDWNALISTPKSYVKSLSIKKLVEVLKYCSDMYFNKGKTVVPDLVYDIIEDKLRKRKPDHPLLKQVGYRVKGKGKVKLPYPMPSLNKVRPQDKNVEPWLRDHAKSGFVVSDKLDGQSILAVWDKKKGWSLYTRGDGRVGGDISFLVPFLKLPKPRVSKLAVRGEAIIKSSAFKRLFKEESENPRNFVTGIFSPNRRTVHRAIKHIDIVFYDILYPREKPSEALKWLKSHGFNVVWFKKFKSLTQDKLSSLLLERKKKSPYEIDGLVVAEDKKHAVPRSNPEFSVAFKMVTPDQKAIAEVVDVEWNVSKHGYLKPVVIIKPVKLRGVTIRRLTGFNARFIKENKIGKGAKLEIIRSGDVIPHILSVLKQAKKPALPKDVKYEWTDSGVDIYIVDERAKDERNIKRITNFFRTLGVEGLSEATFEKLYESGFKTIKSLLKVTSQKLIRKGFGEKTAQKIASELQAIQREPIDLPLFMYASGFFPRDIGYERLKLIVKTVPSFSRIKRESLKKRVISIPGIGEHITEEFIDSLPKFLKFYEKYKDNFKIIRVKIKKPKSQKLKGISVCFSGFRDEDLKQLIEENGGEVKSGISSKLKILLVKEKGLSTTKVKRAKELGVKIMTPAEFLRKFKLKKRR